LKGHVYNCDKIVVGGDLRAVLFAYFNDLPIIFTQLQEPVFYERFRWTLDLSPLGVRNLAISLNTPAGGWSYGIRKDRIWRHLLYILSMSGRVPLSDKAKKIRINSDNTLRVTTERSRLVRFSFNKLVVFDDHNLEGYTELDTDNDPNKVYKVLDWMNVRSGMGHPYDMMEGGDKFVTQIHFYPSERIDGRHEDKKDLIAVSYLTKEELEHFQYSDTYARFKVCDIMKEAGIRGRRNGRDPRDPSRYKYYALKVEASKREIIPLPETDFPEIAEEKKSLIIVRMSDEEIIEWHYGGPTEKLRKLSSRLWKL
jgi:hypothetical protein